MKEKSLYYSPGEIPIKDHKYLSDQKTYEEIQNHQISGLIALGGKVITHNNWIQIQNPSRRESKFLNRVLHINAEDGSDLNLPSNVSIEINKFSQPADIENQLVLSGANHVASHFVLGRPLSTPKIYNKETQLSSEYLIVDLDKLTLEQAIDTFNSFFVKRDEDNVGAIKRMLSNLTRGPHLAVKYNGRPIAVLGAILHDKIGCLYSFIVAPGHRNTELMVSISKSLMARLSETGIKYIYSKSNNKAVVLGSRYTTGMNVLYADRIYEK